MTTGSIEGHAQAILVPEVENSNYFSHHPFKLGMGGKRPLTKIPKWDVDFTEIKSTGWAMRSDRNPNRITCELAVSVTTEAKRELLKKGSPKRVSTE